MLETYIHVLLANERNMGKSSYIFRSLSQLILPYKRVCKIHMSMYEILEQGDVEYYLSPRLTWADRYLPLRCLLKEISKARPVRFVFFLRSRPSLWKIYVLRIVIMVSLNWMRHNFSARHVNSISADLSFQFHLLQSYSFISTAILPTNLLTTSHLLGLSVCLFCPVCCTSRSNWMDFHSIHLIRGERNDKNLRRLARLLILQ